MSAGTHRGVARHRRRLRDDRGSATVELAAALPIVVVLLAVGLTALAALSAKVRCADAAGVTARAVARGAPSDSAGAGTVLPGAEVAVARDGDLVRVTVRTRVRSAPLLPGFTVEERAVAMVEPQDTTLP